jgi:hypothetical protein
MDAGLVFAKRPQLAQIRENPGCIDLRHGYFCPL